MKSLLLSLMLASLAIWASAQNIFNPSFENWSTYNSTQEPIGLETSNLFSFLLTQSNNVSRSSDAFHGNYAAKMETKISGNDTLFGYVTNGSLIQGELTGGIPFAARPDSLSFATKYSLHSGDSATAIVMFKLMGNIVGFGVINFSGTSTTYEQKKTAIQWFINPPFLPDSMLLAVASSNPDINPQNGSWIIVDDFKLDQNPIPSGDFENWNQNTYEDPDQWSSFNIYSSVFPPSYVQKSPDAFSGNYALKIKTEILNNGRDTLAHITNGRILMEDFMGGQKVNYNPKKITGYYKYSPVGQDSALVALRSFGYNTTGQYVNLDNAILKLAPASSYTYFELPLTYNNWPPVDTLGIGFASSNIYDGKANVRAGSELLIDSINIVYQSVGMEETMAQSPIEVYPNPCQDILYIKGLQSQSSVSLLDAQGKIIKQYGFTKRINMNDLPAGFYTLLFKSNTGVQQHKVIKQ